MTAPTLQNLARSVAQGDHMATTALRSHLQPQLERIMRRALQSTTPRSPFTDGLRREAGHVPHANPPAGLLPGEPRLAIHLTNRVIDRLRSAAVPLGDRETLVNSLHAS